MLTKKKLASLAMAGVMTLSLAAPAFAATSESTTNRSLKVTAAYQAVTINVVVPTTGTVIIDPYKLPVTVGTNADGEAVQAKDTQIVTKPLAIKNQSDIDLKVNISTTTALTGNLKLVENAVADPGDGTVTANSAFIYVDVEASTLKGDKDTVSEAAIAADYAAKTWAEYDADNAGKSQLVLKSGTQTMKEAVVLKGSTLDSGAFSEYDEGSVAYIAFAGDCTIEPKTAWTTKDGLTCTMAFTFTPDTSASSSTTTD
jgi:hypothetical protein